MEKQEEKQPLLPLPMYTAAPLFRGRLGKSIRNIDIDQDEMQTQAPPASPSYIIVQWCGKKGFFFFRRWSSLKKGPGARTKNGVRRNANEVEGMNRGIDLNGHRLHPLDSWLRTAKISSESGCP